MNKYNKNMILSVLNGTVEKRTIMGGILELF